VSGPTEGEGPIGGAPRSRPAGDRFRRFLHWLGAPSPVVLETMRSVEVPPITETKRRWSQGDRAGAIEYAYQTTLSDVQRAFHVRFRPDWTNEEVLIFGVTPEMVPIPDFLERLLRLYEPVRYGGAVPPDAPCPDALLQSIYAHHDMWTLYVEAVAQGTRMPPGVRPAPVRPSGAR
jgi:hypothetical protein